MDEAQIKRIINRERKARKEAERLLEEKSTELYHINQNLEETILERTKSLSTALKEAKSAVKSKDEFLSNMSHEIRTPLNAILGFVQLMIQQPYEEKKFSRNLKIINSSSKNLLQIINDILDFSKLQSKKVTLSVIDVNLKEKLTYAFEMFLEQANEKSLLYELIFSEDFPKCLRVDEIKIIQILNNFISNAIKFTSTGQMVVVSVEYHHNTLRVEVKDSGIGIDIEAQHKVFKSFEQEDASVTHNFGGTGLGLAISKELIEVMNAKLIFESTKGQGSNFGFSLQIEQCEKKQKEHKNTSKKCSYKGKILIAEDNEMNIVLMEILMESFNIEFDLVFNGQEAVDAIKANNYALVLMDNQMPIMSGKEATKIIRTFNSTIPIVALSANAITSEQKEFLEVGMNDTLAKPINFEKLEEQFKKYLT